MATTTRPTESSRTTRAREVCAPRGGRARSAVGRRSSFPTSPPTTAPANALSRYRRKVSNQPLVTCDDPAGWRRGARMNLRVLAAADPDTPQRQRDCGAVPIGSQVEIRSKDGSAYYCGLETCGNVWLCPVCSAKIHHRRADELRDALSAWEAAGHAATLVTITVPHDLGDRLSTLIATERAAWKRVTAGAAWQRLKKRLGIAGHVIALEFTWGDANGWHPHYHVLLVHDRNLDAAGIAAAACPHSRAPGRQLPRPTASPPGAGARRPDRPQRLRRRRRRLRGQRRRLVASKEMTRGTSRRAGPAAAPRSRSSPTTTRPATPATATSGANTAAPPAVGPPSDGHEA